MEIRRYVNFSNDISKHEKQLEQIYNFQVSVRKEDGKSMGYTS